MSEKGTTIGFLGGTGDLGQALAVRSAGNYEVLLGSREKQKAEDVVIKIVSTKSRQEHLKDKLRPSTNRQVVESSDIILVTLPAKHALQEVKGLVGHFRGDQLLISTVAPTPKVGEDFIPTLEEEKKADGEHSSSSSSSSSAISIAEQIKDELVLKSINVAAAFQTVPAKALMNQEKTEADIPVACDDKDTYDKTARLIRSIDGLRPLYLGSLQTSRTLESLTSILLNVASHNGIKDPVLKFNPSG
jgi:8-hydroxy-5-deazaflavin:NADPH oxidoreductase